MDDTAADAPSATEAPETGPAAEPAGDANAEAAATTRTAGEAFLAAGAEAVEQPDHADPWSEPRTREDGTAVDDDDLPLNHRLRALELAERGEAADPAGTVSAEAIAQAGERLAAYEANHPRISGKSSKADLEAIAEAEGVDISGAGNNDERAALIRAARPALI